MKLTRENKRMKKLVKKQIMCVMTIACLVLAFCLCPMQKTEARDWGEDYPYGEHEILKFNGKMQHGIYENVTMHWSGIIAFRQEHNRTPGRT